MDELLIDARAKIHAIEAALADIRMHLTDAAARAELRRVMQAAEALGQRFEGFLTEQDADRCSYCGAPPEKQDILVWRKGYVPAGQCPECNAEIPQPPEPQFHGTKDPDVTY